MILGLHNVHTQVEEGTPEERAWLRSYLTFADPSASYRPGAPAFIELCSPMDDSFPAGLTHSVVTGGAKRTLGEGKTAKAAPITVTVRDLRTRPSSASARPAPALDWLRDYQRAALDEATKRTRGVIQIPTGGGKTEVMAALVATLPGTWLVVVPQVDLLTQTAERFKLRTGEECGQLGDGKADIRRVTVATFQTLHKRAIKQRNREVCSLLESVTGVIFDEAHQAPAGSAYAVMLRTKAAYWRFGFSATPGDRGDKRNLFVTALFGRVIHRTTSAELRARGMLADATVRMFTLEQGSGAPTWQGVYGECVTRSKRRNALLVQLARMASKPALLFVQHVQHGRALVPLLQRAGLNVELAWGDLKSGERKACLERLVSGKLDLVVCSSVFQQGIDVPSLVGIVVGGGGASVIQTLQRIGRGTRTTESKRAFEVWDVLDGGHRWLETHAAERQSAYEREGYTVHVEQPPEEADLPPVKPRLDEHGFLLGSGAGAKWKADRRKEVTQVLAGVDRIRTGRGRVPMPHRLDASGACSACGAREEYQLAMRCPKYGDEVALAPPKR